MSSDILITDLTCALPADGWTDADSHVHKPIAAPPPGKWRIIDYKSDQYNGRALHTSVPDSAVLRIPLNAAGWHAVSLALSERQAMQTALEVRLTGDDYWHILRTTDGEGGPLHEEPWRFADLTGRDLEVRFPRDFSRLPFGFRPPKVTVQSNLYAVRLAPVRPEHLPIVQSARHRRLVYINDGFGLFFHDGVKGAQHILDSLGHWRDGDWSVCCFGNIGGDLVNYPSAVGTLCGQGGWEMARAGDHNVRDNLQGMIDAGIDPLQVAIDTAHAQGQQFWLYLRPQAYAADPPFDHILRSRFYSEHPEYRCLAADGTAFSKLSIAYPVVRQQLNTILSEALARGADGVTLAFVRGYPVVRYEPPVCERFFARYGEAAQQVPDTDPRLCGVWAEYVAEWLREIRQLLDAAGPSPRAARRELSAIVGPDLEWNLQFGYDVAAWAREGLVDVLMPYPYRKPRQYEVHVAEFAQALAGTSMQLLPSLGSFFQYGSLAAVRTLAHQFYQAGAHGLSRWDAPGCLARLGLDDPELLALWCEHYLPPQEIELTELAGINLQYFGPLLGF